MSLTNTLFKLARASATGRAVRKGPSALAKREIRKSVYRRTNRTTARVLRSLFK